VTRRYFFFAAGFFAAGFFAGAALMAAFGAALALAAGFFTAVLAAGFFAAVFAAGFFAAAAFVVPALRVVVFAALTMAQLLSGTATLGNSTYPESDSRNGKTVSGGFPHMFEGQDQK
jgi:hypothetical protein